MANDNERPQRLAILIDADNASPRMVAGLFEEAAAIGEASVRRIYGDFSGTRLKGWAEVLSTYAIIPHQNFANTAGKNASDIALVIDAMDLLHTGRFDAFCLVSSDSDFTRLAARIREQESTFMALESGRRLKVFGKPASASSTPKTLFLWLQRENRQPERRTRQRQIRHP
jgi:hypothetical protein